jgi:hypothetical protein
MENSDLVVCEELSLDNNRGLASGALPLVDDVLRLDRESVEDLGEYHAVLPTQACVDTIVSVRTWSSRPYL